MINKDILTYQLGVILLRICYIKKLKAAGQGEITNEEIKQQNSERRELLNYQHNKRNSTVKSFSYNPIKVHQNDTQI